MLNFVIKNFEKKKRQKVNFFGPNTPQIPIFK